MVFEACQYQIRIYHGLFLWNYLDVLSYSSLDCVHLLLLLKSRKLYVVGKELGLRSLLYRLL